MQQKIVYVYPALPCFIIFIVCIISASIYITKDADHKTCTLSHPKESDYLQEYVLGSIIVGYIFLAVYSNILLEIFPKLKGLATSFLLLFVWAIGSFVWNIVGASLVAKSYCQKINRKINQTSTQYYGIAVLNLVIYFLFFGGLLFYTIFVWVMHKKEDKAATQVNPNYTAQQDVNNNNKNK